MALFAPPLNFALVSPGVYRSGFPTRHNLGFLQTLGIRTLLRIEDCAYPVELQDWIESVGIQVVDCILTPNQEPFFTMDHSIVATALRTALDRHEHPVLIHSLRGQQRAGVLVGCLRRLQRWSLAAIFEEYRRYAGPSSSLLDLQYIELFDLSLAQQQSAASPRGGDSGISSGGGQDCPGGEPSSSKKADAAAEPM
jgi:tyrosine-protein phosphatase SIW14